MVQETVAGRLFVRVPAQVLGWSGSLSLKYTTSPVILPNVPVRVAVKVTGSPTTDGFREDVSVIEVGTRFTCCWRTGDVLGALAASPE
jgi:hypothetical protein